MISEEMEASKCFSHIVPVSSSPPLLLPAHPSAITAAGVTPRLVHFLFSILAALPESRPQHLLPGQKRAVNWIWLNFVLTNLLFLKKKKRPFLFLSFLDYAWGDTGMASVDEAGWIGKGDFNEQKGLTKDQGDIERGMISRLPGLGMF